jgi:branched-chain amino acid aminotransferase
LDEITRALPEGAYTTLRTYQHWSTIHLKDHFDRLKETCRLTGCTIEIDQDLIRFGLKHIVNNLSQVSELRLRISIDLNKNKGQIFLAAEPLTTPSTVDYQAGVRVATKIMTRNNPKAKVSHFITSANEIRKQFGKDFNEIIMIGEDGQMLEGLSSNFFAVKDGKIWTEDKDVLSGITRSDVLDLSVSLGIPIIKRGILVDELRFVKEAFITSASRSILPIKEIDRQWMGSKVPGPITSKLIKALNEKISQNLELL